MDKYVLLLISLVDVYVYLLLSYPSYLQFTKWANAINCIHDKKYNRVKQIYV